MNAPSTWLRKDAASARHPFGLAQLIDPVGVDTFLAEHWEREPLILHRDDPGYFRDLLTLEQLDRILSTTNLRSTDLRVLDGGVETPIPRLLAESGGTGNGLEALYARYRTGATVSVTFLHERWEPVKQLCQALAVELSAQMQTNVYLTPAGGNQGLVPHYDTHDVFVVQVHGVKHWCLYESPTELPLPTQPYRRTEDGAGPPVQEFDLHPGDLLYLPRGQVHAATSKDTATCHLTVGVRPVLWATLVRAAVEQVVSEDPRFRHALPPGFATDPALRERTEAEAVALFGALREKLSAAEIVTQARQQAWLGRQPALQGHLLDLEALPSVGPDVWLTTRPDLLSRIERDGDQVVLEFHGKRLRFPAHVEEALRYVADAGSFVGAGIPGTLDESGRTVLVQTLIREGFVTVA